MQRKEFLTAASALLLGTAMGRAPAAAAAGPKLTGQDRQRLKGVLDLHLHAAPDTKPRLINELEAARLAQAAGMRGILLKSNDFSCHDRAWLISQVLPGFACLGSICMNDVVGSRVNPTAARKAVRTTGGLCRCIWMPTQNAVHQVRTLGQKQAAIPVLSPAGKVLPEVVEVMEICAEHDIIFATGHSSPAESLVLARKAREVGVGKFVVTHANSSIWRMTPDEIRRAIDLGAWIELSYLTNLWGPGTGLPDFERMTDRQFCELVAIDVQRTFVTTDLGQVGMPSPVEGMLACIRALETAGLGGAAVDALTRRNPAHLAGL